MTILNQTHAALRHITQHAPASLTRTRALLLGQQLTTCTTSPPTSGMLRQIVIAVRNLVGPGWLAGQASNPAISAFTALDSTPVPPPLPALDHILADCLWARFGPASTHQASPAPDLAAAQSSHAGEHLRNLPARP